MATRWVPPDGNQKSYVGICIDWNGESKKSNYWVEGVLALTLIDRLRLTCVCALLFDPESRVQVSAILPYTLTSAFIVSICLVYLFIIILFCRISRYIPFSCKLSAQMIINHFSWCVCSACTDCQWATHTHPFYALITLWPKRSLIPLLVLDYCNSIKALSITIIPGLSLFLDDALFVKWHYLSHRLPLLMTILCVADRQTHALH